MNRLKRQRKFLAEIPGGWKAQRSRKPAAIPCRRGASAPDHPVSKAPVLAMGISALRSNLSIVSPQTAVVVFESIAVGMKSDEIVPNQLFNLNLACQRVGFSHANVIKFFFVMGCFCPAIGQKIVVNLQEILRGQGM